MNSQYVLFVGLNRGFSVAAIETITAKKIQRGFPKKNKINKNCVTEISKVFEYGDFFVDNLDVIKIFAIHRIKDAAFLLPAWSKRGLGTVVLLDGCSGCVQKQLREIVAEYPSSLFSSALSIGIVNSENNTINERNQINKYLRKLKINSPVFDVDINNFYDVSFLFKSLLFSNLISA